MKHSKTKELKAEKPVTRCFKGFDRDFSCRGHKYAVGETYKIDGAITICGRGFHACRSALDVLNYYPASTSRYAIVDLIGEVKTEDGSDSKICAAEIHVVREVTYFELWQAHREEIVASVKEASATGYRGHAAATGDSGHAAATGNRGHAAATGDSGHAAATGNSGHAAATGYSGHAAATGDSGHAAATGYSGHAAATGDRGHAAATGNRGHAAATGDSGHAAATGYRGHAAATGKNSVAAAFGCFGRAKASAGNWIVLAQWDDDYNLVAVHTRRCGEAAGDLKSNVWYRLDGAGAFVSCEGDDA